MRLLWGHVLRHILQLCVPHREYVVARVPIRKCTNAAIPPFCDIDGMAVTTHILPISSYRYTQLQDIAPINPNSEYKLAEGPCVLHWRAQ